ncbi:hypothetical protein BKA62DRAFT_348787 [Auriculariales sp. MPI-PUGE-AT-0066]|nr:hypothetical protein BKA62DRAFT_348787 [Auriculariales sp. MPI-PUGE-AT-0066]
MASDAHKPPHDSDAVISANPWRDSQSASGGAPKRIEVSRPLTGSRKLFFYGTLRLPHALRSVLRLPETPTLHKAQLKTTELRLKMWGQYPALALVAAAPDGVEQTTTVIEGRVYDCLESRVRQLDVYETENYRLHRVDVEVATGDDWETAEAWTYIWNGYPEELSEGAFDASLFAEDDE